MSDTNAQALLDELTRLEDLRNPNRCEGKRQFQRFVVRGDAEMAKMDRSRIDELPIPVLLRDLGRGGVGFITQIPLEVNSVWRVCFLQHGYTVGQMAVIVRHCRTVREGVHLIGAQFCSESGLLYQMGINPQAVRDGDAPAAITDAGAFLAPSEVA
ncbi:MAG: hypothetical protein IT440_15080 [Phycisphaeraceae bacterium]|nr:hypothetical protein [Phycisphaeraceae bacterium]